MRILNNHIGVIHLLLNWEMGCWSLTERLIKSKEDCKDCDSCRDNLYKRIF